MKQQASDYCSGKLVQYTSCLLHWEASPLHKLLAGPLNMAANHRGSSNFAAVPRLLWDIPASPFKHVSGMPGKRPAFPQLPMLLMHPLKDQTAIVLSIAACE